MLIDARFVERDILFHPKKNQGRENPASLLRARSFRSCEPDTSISGFCRTEPMGRGRGRGRKITNGRTHEDKGSSGEEVAPARKRRGRPKKRVAEKKVNQAEAKNVEEVDDGDEDYQVGAGDDAKLKASGAENISTGTGTTKRNRAPKEEDDSNLDVEENSSGTRSSNDESTRSSGFRQVGSRRKNTPRRAAEAGV